MTLLRVAEVEGKRAADTTIVVAGHAISDKERDANGNSNSRESSAAEVDAKKKAAAAKVVADEKLAADAKVASDAKAALDAQIKKMVADGEADTGVPSSPAASILGLDPNKASTPRTPKDLAAAVINGRGSDGKIKTGVSLDFSLTQFLDAIQFVDWGSGKLKDAPAVKTQASKIAMIAQEKAIAARKPDDSVASLMKKLNSKYVDDSHVLSNRLKFSIATTEDQQGATAKSANDVSFGMHYVFVDDSDPLTTNCDGANAGNKLVMDALKAGNPSEDFGGSQKLRAFRDKAGKAYRDDKTAPDDIPKLKSDLEMINALCSLTPAERLRSKALMFGIANSYTLADGRWSDRAAAAKGFWIGGVTPGYALGAEGSVQVVGQYRILRDQIVADPADAAKKIKQDAKQWTARLRAANPRGNVSYEYSRANTEDKSTAVRSTTRRQGIAIEWQVAKGVWLVSSGGRETRNGASSSTPFMVTNLRFGGSPTSSGD
ncbi:MAG: hypothetical protein JNN20_03420 [Betaproteobacteria bacterium]|nr:hypothetical protein [Betaproteobacteria bacterium]